eukprot:gene7600-8400_t
MEKPSKIGPHLVGKKDLRGDSVFGAASREEVEELLWLQCARLLMSLPLSSLHDLEGCLIKILDNLLAHPGDEKFSTLKKSNASLQRHLFAYPGGPQILLALGFQWSLLHNPDGSEMKVLTLPVSYVQNPAPFLRQAQACRAWLAQTCATCEELYRQKLQAWSDDLDSMPLPDIPAESLVLVDMPSISAKAGFLLEDTLSAVREFACSFFHPSMRHLVYLRTIDSSQALEKELGCSLADLSFYPRVRLIASTREIEGVVAAARERVLAQHAEKKEVKVINRRKVEEDKRQREQDRERVLAAFRGDRERFLENQTATEQAEQLLEQEEEEKKAKLKM